MNNAEAYAWMDEGPVYAPRKHLYRLDPDYAEHRRTPGYHKRREGHAWGEDQLLLWGLLDPMAMTAGGGDTGGNRGGTGGEPGKT